MWHQKQRREMSVSLVWDLVVMFHDVLEYTGLVRTETGLVKMEHGTGTGMFHDMFVH